MMHWELIFSFDNFCFKMDCVLGELCHRVFTNFWKSYQRMRNFIFPCISLWKKLFIQPNPVELTNERNIFVILSYLCVAWLIIIATFFCLEGWECCFIIWFFFSLNKWRNILNFEMEFIKLHWKSVNSTFNKMQTLSVF